MTERRARRIAVIGFVLWMAAHLFWVFRLQINWDEFALLSRAHDSILQGRLVGGGRPGLSTLLLMPIVHGCRDAVETVVRARLAWTPFVAGILLGLWFLLVRLFAARETRHRDALIGVALIALVPAFLNYTVHVRTDQPAIAFGLLGGLALLASRERIGWAGLAGILFGVGYLSSQKLLYVVALVGLLGIVDTLTHRLRWKRDLGRTILLLIGGGAAIFAFRTLISGFVKPPGPINVEAQMSWFEFYRDAFGYGYYRLMLPRLIVPLGLMVLVISLSPFCLRESDRVRQAVVASSMVVLLGLVVMVFHAGALPYFWMTLGLFPAVAVAVGMPVLRAKIPDRRRGRILVFAVALLVATAFARGLDNSRDGQIVQRETMALVNASFPPSAEGFHPTRALFCRDGTRPFPTFFGRTLYHWHEEEGAVEEFIAEFRRRPVSFIVASPRMRLFPEAVRDFWSAHYVPYSSALMIPGMEVKGGAELTRTFEVLVPGLYTLHADNPDGSLEVDGTTMAATEARRLDTGAHEIANLRGVSSALLTLAVPTAPGPTTDHFFTVY